MKHILISITDEQLDRILEVQTQKGFDTVQETIMAAIEAYINIKMTNQEWLATLTPEQWWNVVYKWLLHEYGSQWTDTRLAVIEWLKKEHEQKD